MTPGRLRAVAALVLTVLAVASVVGLRGGRGDDAAAPERSEGRQPATSAAPATDGERQIDDPDSSEVLRQPETPGATGLPRPFQSQRPAVTAADLKALPATASRVGGIVAGFPESDVPVLPGSTVRSSGLSVDRRTAQLSLVADSRRTPGGVLARYRAALVASGFVEHDAPAVSGRSMAAAFTRGADALVVTVTPRGKGARYVVHGTLRPGVRG